MDTISRENNSYLPVAAVIVGALALVLSLVALAKISTAKKEVLTQVDSLTSKIDEAEAQARNAAAAAERVSSTADRASSSITKLAGETNAAFSEVAKQLGDIRGEITKVHDARPSKGSSNSASSGPAVAGPGEYAVKSGDTGYKIATANGVSLSDLQAVNPGVSWNTLKVGQKIKLPAKK